MVVAEAFAQKEIRAGVQVEVISQNQTPTFQRGQAVAS